jgi:glycolate oxidase iron-sulfur subunit
MPYNKDMSAGGKNEEWREQVFHCVRCGACMEVCPTFRQSGQEGMVARGRLALVESLLAGGSEPTRGLADHIARCIGCRACESVCPSGISISAVFAAVRNLLEPAGAGGRLERATAHRFLGSEEGVPPYAARLLTALQQAASARAPGGRLLPWWRDGARRSFPRPRTRPLSELLPERSTPAGASGRVVLFPGCATNLFYPATGLALVEAVNRAGYEVITPRGLRCCGLPFLTMGDLETAGEMAAHNLALLSGIEADAIVTACSSCALALGKELPRLLGPGNTGAEEMAGRVEDIHLFLARLKAPAADAVFDTAGEAVGGGRGMRVTWHDPCHLRWGLGITAEPRELLRRVPGIEFVEPNGAGDCCGGGGLYSLRYYDTALAIGRKRARAIAATGADIVATGCPGCRSHLTDVLRRGGSGARVVHTVELLAGEA